MENLRLRDLQTGYFAHPDDSEAPFPFVHAIKHELPEQEFLPLCDAAIPDGHEYQWCSGSITWTYVDCQPCRNLLNNMATAEQRDPLVMFRHPAHV